MNPEYVGQICLRKRHSISVSRGFPEREQVFKKLPGSSEVNLFLTPSNALFFLRQSSSGNDLVPTDTAVFAMTVVGANPAPKMTGRDELPGKNSYFLGGDPKKWRTDISTFGKVQYEDIYPGIDLAYHGTHGQLEYDFVLHPGASPATIAIEFTGMKNIRLSCRGELVLETVSGQICFHKPVAYQDDQGYRRPVKSHYRRIKKHRVGFVVGAYDSSKTLIIDPMLSTGPGGNIPQDLRTTGNGSRKGNFESKTCRSACGQGRCSQLVESGNSEVGTGAPGRGRQ